MKKLLILFVLVSSISFAQSDTLALAETFYKQYDLATKNAPLLNDVDNAIDTLKKLKKLKNNKADVCLYLGNLYYSRATKFTTPKKEKYVVGSFRGYVDKEAQKQALNQAKLNYQYFIEHTKVKDDDYRAAQNGILRIKSKLDKL